MKKKNTILKKRTRVDNKNKNVVIFNGTLKEEFYM